MHYTVHIMTLVAFSEMALCTRTSLGRVAKYQCKTTRGVLGLLCPIGGTQLIAVTRDMQIARASIDVDGKIHLYMGSDVPDYENFLLDCLLSADGTRLIGFTSYRTFPDQWISVRITHNDVVVTKHHGALPVHEAMLTSHGVLYQITDTGSIESLYVDHVDPMIMRLQCVEDNKNVLIRNIFGPVWCQRIESFVFIRRGLYCARRTQSDVFMLSAHTVDNLPVTCADFSAVSYSVMSADERWLVVPILNPDDHMILIVLEVVYTPILKFVYKTTLQTAIQVHSTYIPLVACSTLNPSVIYYICDHALCTVCSINLDTMATVTVNTPFQFPSGMYNVAGFIMQRLPPGKLSTVISLQVWYYADIGIRSCVYRRK
jgi:hypothetical protein